MQLNSHLQSHSALSFAVSDGVASYIHLCRTQTVIHSLNFDPSQPIVSVVGLLIELWKPPRSRFRSGAECICTSPRISKLSLPFPSLHPAILFNRQSFRTPSPSDGKFIISFYLGFASLLPFLAKLLLLGAAAWQHGIDLLHSRDWSGR